MKVAIYWHTEDVLGLDDSLTEREADAVLLLACKANHDAENGVSWETLRFWIDVIKEDGTVTDRTHEHYGHYLEAAA